MTQYLIINKRLFNQIIMFNRLKQKKQKNKIKLRIKINSKLR